MSELIPHRITQGREWMGLSKTEVATDLNVSPAAVAQWESGAKTPSIENLARLASTLNVPLSFFIKPVPSALDAKGPLSFRSWKSAPVKRANRRAERFSDMTSEIFLWLNQHLNLPAVNLPDLEMPSNPSLEQIDELALALRTFWNLGTGPILKLGELLESNGIVISPISFGDARFDAFSRIVGGIPYIFLGSDKNDRARSRFDACHELAHLVFHQHFSEMELSEAHDEIEKQAHRFASSFLLPRDSFGREITDISLSGFMRLKPKWGVSVQAMVFWAKEQKIIDDQESRNLWRQMAGRGWRKAQGEPLDNLIPEVRRSIFPKALQLLEENGIIKRWEIPSNLDLPISVLSQAFDLNLDEVDPVTIGKVIPFRVQNSSQMEA